MIADSAASSPSPSLSIASANDFLGMADLISQLPDTSPGPQRSFLDHHPIELDVMVYGSSDFDFVADPYSGSPPGASEAPRVDAALPPTTGNAGTPPRPDSHSNVDHDVGPGGPPSSHPPSGPRPAGPRSGRVSKCR